MNLNHSDQSWYMDSDTSSHLTADPGKITTPLPPSPIQSIFMGNGHNIPIYGSGHTQHKLPTQTYNLLHILYSPHIIKNLLSIRKFTIDNNVFLCFDPYGFSVKELQTGKFLSRHNSSGDFYPFTPPSIPSALVTISSP